MKFSIVTPSFNQGRFITDTIESVLSQAGPFEIEYFVMDGGSTDETVEILEQYDKKLRGGEYPIACKGVEFQWTSGPDGGQSDAINKGLRLATGDYCSYINSDDTFFPGAFAAIGGTFESDPAADFVFGDGDVIDESGNLQWVWLSRPYDHKVMTGYHFLWNEFTNYIMQQSTFWRRNVVDRIGYFDETMHYAMDVEYWIRAGHSNLKLVHLPVKIGKFRMIQGTKSLSSPTVFWGDQLEVFRRYRPVGQFGKFFSFFVFNLARHHDLHFSEAASEAIDSCERWKSLSPDQWDALRTQIKKGLMHARLRTARQLLKTGRRSEAVLSYRRALALNPFCAVAGPGAALTGSLLMGNRVTSIAERAIGRAISQYRRRRFDYRYTQKN